MSRKRQTKSVSIMPTVTKDNLPKQKGIKKKEGRPWFDGRAEDIILSKLEQALKTGTTHRRACLYADITEASFYRYLEAHPDFRDRIRLWEENILLLAESKLFESVQSASPKNGKNMGDVHYVLERRDKARYSPQVNIITDDAGGALTDERKQEIAKSSENWYKKSNEGKK
jgi:hypothetical protein